MEHAELRPLLAAYQRRLSATDMRFKRYLHRRINWDVRMIGIMGARGVGKTTLLMQHIKETFGAAGALEKAFYASLDDLWFDSHTLEELVDHLYARGITNMFFDEVHKCPDWTRRLKNMYDNYPDLRIVYTGSAMLAIEQSKADLSRRQTLYTMQGMSFREYLEFEAGLSLPALTLTELLERHVGCALDIVGKCRVLKAFDDYLVRGYYPFYKESGEDYLLRLREVVKLVIESDVPAMTDLTFASLEKLKKLLMVIAPNVPLVPNINRLSEQLETTRDHCLKMLNVVEKAGLIILLYDRLKDYKHLTNPKKIFLNNANLMNALATQVSMGNMRETFFANQVGASHSLTIPKDGDFRVDDKYLFEVGGSSKTFKQIANLPNSFLAVDDTEVGSEARIPLWMFGMLY